METKINQFCQNKFSKYIKKQLAIKDRLRSVNQRGEYDFEINSKEFIIILLNQFI